MPVLHESNVEEKEFPGRFIRWPITPDNGLSQYSSMCITRVPVGSTVRPAHSHPNGEEIIYISAGRGRTVIDGVVSDVCEGSVIIFPQGSIHMLQNCGDTDLKAICFFAPPSDISTYKFFEDVEFPE